MDIKEINALENYFGQPESNGAKLPMKKSVMKLIATVRDLCSQLDHEKKVCETRGKSHCKKITCTVCADWFGFDFFHDRPDSKKDCYAKNIHAVLLKEISG